MKPSVRDIIAYVQGVILMPIGFHLGATPSHSVPIWFVTFNNPLSCFTNTSVFGLLFSNVHISPIIQRSFYSLVSFVFAFTFITHQHILKPYVTSEGHIVITLKSINYW